MAGERTEATFAESGATKLSFEDCLRLRELADRQTLTKDDRTDLAAIADRLHALAARVSSIDTRYAERRSTNDVAYDILQAAPHVEALVEEWFAIESAARKRLYDRLDRIRAAAESDADLEGTARRDFLLRETR